MKMRERKYDRRKIDVLVNGRVIAHFYTGVSAVAFAKKMRHMTMTDKEFEEYEWRLEWLKEMKQGANNVRRT